MSRKKLIEVALPLAEINAEAAREKSIRHGHPSTLHLWWARRPLAACRAVLFASLIDDPDQEGVPPALLERIDRLPPPDDRGPDWDAKPIAEQRRDRLFEFIKKLVKWENSTDETILGTARELILAATDGNPPPVLDPFCGGGSIPLEAQRLGLEAHASDLNPVAVLITKALICLAMGTLDGQVRRSLMQDAVAIARQRDDRYSLALALGMLAIDITHTAGPRDDRAIEALYEEALAHSRAEQFGFVTAGSLRYYGKFAQFRGDYARARALLDEAVAVARANADNWGLGSCLGLRGELACSEGTTSARTRSSRRALPSIARWASAALDWLVGAHGEVALARGELDRARQLLGEALRLAQRNDNGPRVARWVSAFGRLALRRGDVARAARLFGGAGTICPDLDDELDPIQRAGRAAAVAEARATLGDAAFVTAWDRGRMMSREQAVAEALAGEG